MGQRVGEEGASEGRSVMERTGVEPPGDITPDVEKGAFHLFPVQKRMNDPFSPPHYRFPGAADPPLCGSAQPTLGP